MKRIIAWTAIIALAGLYVMTLVSALLAKPGSDRLFHFCLGMTIAVPILAWILIWCIGRFTDKKTIADLDILNSNEKERARMEEALHSEMLHSEMLHSDMLHSEEVQDNKTTS